jgi:hypothetical protein
MQSIVLRDGARLAFRLDHFSDPLGRPVRALAWLQDAQCDQLLARRFDRAFETCKQGGGGA